MMGSISPYRSCRNWFPTIWLPDLSHINKSHCTSQSAKHSDSLLYVHQPMAPYHPPHPLTYQSTVPWNFHWSERRTPSIQTMNFAWLSQWWRCKKVVRHWSRWLLTALCKGRISEALSCLLRFFSVSDAGLCRYWWNPWPRLCRSRRKRRKGWPTVDG